MFEDIQQPNIPALPNDTITKILTMSTETDTSGKNKNQILTVTTVNKYFFNFFTEERRNIMFSKWKQYQDNLENHQKAQKEILKNNPVDATFCHTPKRGILIATSGTLLGLVFCFSLLVTILNGTGGNRENAILTGEISASLLLLLVCALSSRQYYPALKSLFYAHHIDKENAAVNDLSPNNLFSVKVEVPEKKAIVKPTETTRLLPDASSYRLTLN